MTQQRRDRIGWALDDPAIRRNSSRKPRDAAAGTDETRYADFQFTDVAAALAAFQQRLPGMVSVLKALQIGELEVEGQYVQELHGPILTAWTGAR